VIAFGSPLTLGSSKTSSGHHVKRVTEAAWVHETSFVEVHRDARRGLVLFFYFSIFLFFYLSIFLSFYLSIFLSFCRSRINLAQSRKWSFTKGENNWVISEDDADGHLEPTRISLDWCPTKAQQI
jgi:hypothetical protein